MTAETSGAIVHRIGGEDIDTEVARTVAEVGGVEAWYTYNYGDYDGSGQLIFRTADGEWGLHDMSHCSCNGPTDDISPAIYESLEALGEACSGEYYADSVAPLIASIVSHLQRAEER